MNYIFILITVINAFVFILYGIDKYKATHKKYRIPESTLVLLPFFMSSLGAMLGMIVFNHKTSKTKFRILIPLAFLVNAIVVILYFAM